MSTAADRDWSPEVCYQVYVRSFRDGNGDGIGDFAGLTESLDYLGNLGITALWLNPIFPSPSHHNYFTTEFFETDPEYGSVEEFVALCRAAHARGMKILLDSETQYVPATHPWFQTALADPDSPMRERFLFTRREPAQWLHLTFNLPVDGRQVPLSLKDLPLLNLAHPAVMAFQQQFYSFWLDPLGKGDGNSGVDGYRLDHVMDDLDGYGVLTGLLRNFWRPLIEHVRRRAPGAFFLAEPADWHTHGGELLREADIDGVFAIPLMFALRSGKTAELVTELKKTLADAVPGRSPFVVLENHDVTRFASAVWEDPARERLGAVLNLTLPGIPTLYYGQELGMTGRIGSPASDVHIPAREAFRWRRDIEAPGMAVWYRDHAVWQQTGITRDDGRTLEDQRSDPDSLWHLYRRLIALRRASRALCEGDFELLETGLDDVIAFRRSIDRDTATVVINHAPVSAALDPGGLRAPGEVEVIAVGASPDGAHGLAPWGCRVYTTGD